MKKNWTWFVIILLLPVVLMSCTQSQETTNLVKVKDNDISADAVIPVTGDGLLQRYVPLILEQFDTPTPKPTPTQTPTETPTPLITTTPGSGEIVWSHLSSESGDLEPPSLSLQQTASLVLDIDLDGINDFVIAIRRDPGPSVVWYRRNPTGWEKYLIDNSPLDIEAGGDFYDIDQDGDLDVVFGGDGSRNRIWWWENPYPNYDPNVGWTRREIKNSGENKHHDMVFGDFDGDSVVELAFWNQGAKKLFLAEIPSSPKSVQTWQYQEIYSWSSGEEHEGLTSADIDGDGLADLIGGGRWFKYQGIISSPLKSLMMRIGLRGLLLGN